jgi:hypothetical protein
MARNTGKAALQISDYEVGQRMRTFDNFPQALRIALAHSDNDWSVRQCHISLHGGGDGIKAHTANELVAIIEQNDARRRRQGVKT